MSTLSKKRSAEEMAIPAIVLCSADDSNDVKSSIKYNSNASILIRLSDGEPKREVKRVRFSESPCSTPLLDQPTVSAPPPMTLSPIRYVPFFNQSSVDKDIVNSFIGLIQNPDNSEVRTILLYIRFQEYLIANPHMLTQTLCITFLQDITTHYALMTKNINVFTEMLYEYNDHTTVVQNFNTMFLHNRLSISMSKMKACIDSL